MSLLVFWLLRLTQPVVRPHERCLPRQAHDTRAAALQEALTQSMLECMTLHAEAEYRASEVSYAGCPHLLDIQ